MAFFTTRPQATTVDSITAPLQAIVDQLEAHRDGKQGERTSHLVLVDHHTTQAEVARIEALKAHTTAEKIKGLLA